MLHLVRMTAMGKLIGGIYSLANGGLGRLYHVDLYKIASFCTIKNCLFI